MRERAVFRKTFRRSVARAEVGYASVRFKNGRLWIWAFIKGIIPLVLLRLVASARKKTGQVLPCPENQILRLKGNQNSHHTRFALLTFLQADSLRAEAIRLSEKPSVAAFIRVTDPRAHALLRMRGAPEDHRPGLDSERRELR